MKVQENSKKGQELRAAKKLKGVYKHCINTLSSSPNTRHIIKNIEEKMQSTSLKILRQKMKSV